MGGSLINVEHWLKLSPNFHFYVKLVYKTIVNYFIEKIFLWKSFYLVKKVPASAVILLDKVIRNKILTNNF